MIEGIFVKSTKEVIFSRNTHDYRTSSDKTVSIDGGRDYVKISGNIDNCILLDINEVVLLNQILTYDYLFGNTLAENYPKGYHGLYTINDESNLDFFKKLIINWDDIEEFI